MVKFYLRLKTAKSISFNCSLKFLVGKVFKQKCMIFTRFQNVCVNLLGPGASWELLKGRFSYEIQVFFKSI